MFDTKIKIILRDDLESWQELNVTAFLMSGIGSINGLVGEIYHDASGNTYLPMSKQPIVIHTATKDELTNILRRVTARDDMMVDIFTEELFNTFTDEDNHLVINNKTIEEFNLVGIGIRGKKNPLDKILKGIPLHK